MPSACDELFRPSEVEPTRLDAHGITQPYILYVASRRPYKNIDGLIRAYYLLKRRHNLPHRLVITGLGGRADNQLFGLIKECGLERQVILTGFVPDEELPLIYNGAELFVFPSFYEGFGLPIVEAMACGLPVASSNRTSLPEVAGRCALFFDPADVEDMAQTIYRLLTDEGLRQRLISCGRQRAALFTWERVAAEVLKALEDVAGR